MTDAPLVTEAVLSMVGGATFGASAYSSLSAVGATGVEALPGVIAVAGFVGARAYLRGGETA